MNEAKAVAIASRARSMFEVPFTFEIVSVKQKIIELVNSDQTSVEELPGPGPVCDVVAWLVTFGQSAEGVELAIDNRTGDVVRIQRTAGAITAQPQVEADR